MSADAEQYLIGAMLINNDIIEQVCAIVNPEDFGTRKYRDLMYLIMSARSKGLHVDAVSLSTIRESLSDGDLTIACAAEIHSQSSSWNNYEAFARAVKENAARKTLQKALQSILLSSDSMTIWDIAESAQRAIASVFDNSRSADVLHVFDHLAAVKDDIVERMEAGGGVKGLLTGYPDIDKLVGGMRGGHVVVIAGRPGSGKTTLGMNIAENIAAKGTPALIFSLEMSGKELARRSLASIGRIPLDCIDSGKIEEYGAHLTSGVTRIKDLPIFVFDKNGMGISQIRAIASFQRRTNKIGLIVIDYIGLVRTKSGKNSTRSQELGEISRQCKEMAKELDMPVIVLAQLNRDIDKGGDRDPRLSDLRDSGEIEQDADVVIFSSNAENDGIAKITIAKNRHGKTGQCYLTKRFDISRFEGMAGSYQPAVAPQKRAADYL